MKFLQFFFVILDFILILIGLHFNKLTTFKGSINEWGPHSVRFSGKSASFQERNTLQLINELGLDDVILPVG